MVRGSRRSPSEPVLYAPYRTIPKIVEVDLPFLPPDFWFRVTLHLIESSS